MFDVLYVTVKLLKLVVTGHWGFLYIRATFNATSKLELNGVFKKALVFMTQVPAMSFALQR